MPSTSGIANVESWCKGGRATKREQNGGEGAESGVGGGHLERERREQILNNQRTRRPRQLQPYDFKITHSIGGAGTGTGFGAGSAGANRNGGGVGGARAGAGSGTGGTLGTVEELLDPVAGQFEPSVAVRNWQYQLTCDKF